MKNSHSGLLLVSNIYRNNRKINPFVCTLLRARVFGVCSNIKRQNVNFLSKTRHISINLWTCFLLGKFANVVCSSHFDFKPQLHKSAELSAKPQRTRTSIHALLVSMSSKPKFIVKFSQMNLNLLIAFRQTNEVFLHTAHYKVTCRQTAAALGAAPRSLQPCLSTGRKMISFDISMLLSLLLFAPASCLFAPHRARQGGLRASVSDLAMGRSGGQRTLIN